MKRLLVIILATIYLAVSSGFTVNVHYCMGRLVDTTLADSSNEEHDCTHCGMKKKKGGNGCCRDEQKIVKHVADGALAKEVKLMVQQLFTLPLPKHYQVPERKAIVAEARPSFLAHPPPDPHPLPLYLSICNLRI